MLPKGSLSIIADALAKEIYRQHCEELNKTIEIELRKAFSSERISQERVDRIIHQFSLNMRG